MTDMLQKGLELLQQMQNKFASVEVSYQRDVETITVNATLGETMYDIEDECGITVKTQIMDFLIASEDLILAGGRTEPKVGDCVRYTRPNRTDVYEVMSLGAESHFRYCDPYNLTLRIHTKLINAE